MMTGTTLKVQNYGYSLQKLVGSIIGDLGVCICDSEPK